MVAPTEENAHRFPCVVILNEVKDPAQRAASSRAGSFVISFLRMTYAALGYSGFLAAGDS